MTASTAARAAAGVLAQVLHLRPLQHRRDAARRHAHHRMLARHRQRPQDALDVGRGDGADVHAPELRQHVGVHRRPPVARRLRRRAALPDIRLLGGRAPLGFRERHRAGAARVAAGARHGAVVRRDPARVGKPHQLRAAESDVDAPAVDHEPLHPGAGAAVADAEHEAVAVDVATGAGVAHLLRGEGVAEELGHGVPTRFTGGGSLQDELSAFNLSHKKTGQRLAPHGTPRHRIARVQVYLTH